MNVRCNGCFELYDDGFDICPYCGYYTGMLAKEPYFLPYKTVLNGRYLVGKVLGFGGFGITYKAWDNVLESVVAIKEYYPSGIVNRQPGTGELILFKGEKKKEYDFGLVRFIDEARNMTSFNTHENIVNVYEYFEENNTAYIVMEFLDGMNLSEYINEVNENLPLDFSLDIIFNIINALKDVHSNGIIHRDISPDNIFICKDGTIKLIDFGAARFSSEEAKNFTIILKPGFAPPEQYEQISDQGPKTDIYALGSTLYYMITGVKPDESTNRKIQDNLEEPNKIISDLPLYINDSILKAMAIEPHLRFESVDEFEKSLKKEMKVTSLKKEKKKRKTKRFVGIFSLMCVLLTVGLLLFVNVKKEAKMLKLNPAGISVWYIGEEGSSSDKAYKNVIKEFSKEYPDIKIQSKCISQKKYDTEIKKAIKSGKTPNLFISNSLDETQIANTSDLRSLVFSEADSKVYFLIKNLITESGSKNCYFLKDYDSIFKNHKQIPASFNMPIIYVNKSICNVKEIVTIKSFEEIDKYINNNSKMLVNPKYEALFTQIFDKKISGDIAVGNEEQFLTGKYSFYFSDTSELYDIRKMPSLGIGISGAIGLDIDEVPCSCGTLWSVYGANQDQIKAAKRLLQFLISSNAQSNIYGKSDSEKALPINKKALETQLTIYEELGFISEIIKKYILIQL